MANLPLILSLAEDLNRMTPFYDPSMTYYNHWPAVTTPHHHALRKHTKDLPIVGKDGFQVCMDVQQFKPSELAVKVVDNHVIVEGKHEEREDEHGYISRHFVRRYTLPKGYDADKVASSLSSDGVLTVQIPKPAIEDKTKERVIQIQQVGPAHLNVKENPKEDKDKEPASKEAVKK